MRLSLYFCLVLFLSAFAMAGGFSVVENGQARASLAIGDNPAVLVQNGVGEFNRYLEEMTGVALPVLAEGGEGAVIRLTVDDSLDDDGFAIDCASPELLEITGSEHGVYYGLYELLKQAGCCWPYPYPLWREVPRKDTVALEFQHLERHPVFKHRIVHTLEGDWQEAFQWMAFNGQNMLLRNPPGYQNADVLKSYGIHPFYSSHSYAFWINRKALNEHPEWNCMFNGRRDVIPLEGPEAWVDRQFCLGNPQAREYFIEQVLNYLREHPDMDTVALEPNDGDCMCECDLCREYCADKSERVFKLTKETAEAVQKEFPGVYCTILSYSFHEAVPSFRMPDNMMVGVVYGNRKYGVPLTAEVNATFRKQLEDWAAYQSDIVYMYEWWKRPIMNEWYYPFINTFQADTRFYQSLGLGGINPEGFSWDPAVEQARAILSWNPEADVWAEIKDMCSKVYGEGGPYMYEYERLLENRNTELAQDLDSIGAYAKFIAPIEDEARNLLDQAEAAVTERRFKQRIAYIRNLFNMIADCNHNWRPALPGETRDEGNVLADGNFEDGWGTWHRNTQGGKYIYELVDEGVQAGRQCARITIEESNWGRIYNESLTSLNPNQTYTVRCAVKTTDGANSAQVWVVNNGCCFRDELGPTGGQWYWYERHGVPAADGFIGLYLTLHSKNENGGKVWYDEVSVIPEGGQPAFYSEELRREAGLIANGGFELGLTGWKNNTQSGSFDYEFDDSEAASGRKCAKITVNQTGWGRIYRENIGSVECEQKYCLKFAYKTTADFRYGLVILGTGGENVNVVLKPTGGEWVVLERNDISFEKPAAAIYLTVTGEENPTGSAVWFDDIILRPVED